MVSPHLTPELERLLEQREVEITRAVTDAVTRDLERRHRATVDHLERKVNALQEELSGVHERLHEANVKIARIHDHPVVRAARLARRAVRRSR
jgi:hypothetical protein